MTTTVIRNITWLVAYDQARGTHMYVTDGDIAFADGAITHVGGRYAGAAVREVDGRGFLVMPGLVNIHSHPASEPMNKGWNDEIGSPKLYNSSLYEIMPIFRPDPDGVPAAATVAYAELLQSGVTTLVDLSVAWDGWLDLAAQSGLRVVLAPMYRSARWYTANGHVVAYEWDEAAGLRAMEAAHALVDRAVAHPTGRLSGMIAPSQIDTCSPELIRQSLAAAKARGLKLQIHAAQSVVEVHEITRRHGLLPIAWLDSLGALTPDTIIGHGIFLDHHGSVHWPKSDEIGRLIATGTSVAHCPTVFLRRGIALTTFGRYVRRGVNVGIGTDTFPHNMIEEIRNALYTSRIVAEDPFDVTTAEGLHAATLGGAKALGRSDIGRLSVGAKADFVMVDTRQQNMRPVRDPLRSLIYAADRAVRHVYVGGEQVVVDGRVTTLDQAAAAERVEAAQRRAEPKVAGLDWAHRSHFELSPLALEVKGRNV
ncbi:MAG TPA: amidohydrolase family protein [Hyphomicrobiaceae bacterium]|nr:amidohydrolase family protein [Hyphomicrobiaceae bacterium]